MKLVPTQHHNLFDFFEKTISKGIVYSSYLIYGKKGVGKRQLVNEIVKTLQCKTNENSYSLKYCNECNGCIKINKGIHPDIRIITPVKETIRIAEARDIITFLDYAPCEARYKIIVIDDADMMNIQAQNALLKTIEEPPLQTIFFFIAHSKSKIIPTIQSRSCILKAQSPLPQDMPPKNKESREYAFDYKQADTLAECISKIKDKENLREYIQHMVIVLKNILFTLNNLSDNKNQARALPIGQLKETKLFEVIDYTLSLEKRIKENCNIPLTLTNLHLKLRRLYENS